MKINQIWKRYVGMNLLGPIIAMTIAGAAGAVADQADSVVQITAESQGLSKVSYDQLPFFGTYWLACPGASSGIILAPLPTPTFDPTLPIYNIIDNEYLVDGTGGQVLPARMATNATTATVAAAVQLETSVISNLVNQIQAAEARVPIAERVTDAKEPLPPGDNNGTNYFTPNGFPFNVSDYGTNIWLLETNISSGVVSGIISNTSPSVRLELQYTFDLMQPWQSADWFVYGSQTTNWTEFSVPAVSSSNLFLRVKSWDIDINGLPIWWEQQYGLTNVNPNALSSAGDGWTIYQKYVLGVAPSAWYTPATPQGLTVNFNESALTATVNWLPSRGNVATYTIEKSYQAHLGGSTQTSDFTVSSGSAYQDTISGNSPDVANGNLYNVSYKVRANYQNGNSSGWTPFAPLQQTTVAGAITPGASGLSTFVAMGIPSSAALIRLLFIDESAVSNNNNSFNYSEDIPVSSFTNGLYSLPTRLLPPVSDSYGNASYAVFVKSVDSSGNSSAPNIVATNWVQMPFYDGRAQLKENLIFQLRAAITSAPFSFYFPTNYGPGIPGEPDHEYDYPSTYAYSGFFPFAGPKYFAGMSGSGWQDYGGNYGGLDILWPFEENYLFRNFVYSLSDSDTNGFITTGAGYPIGEGVDFLLLPSPTYVFQTNTSWADLLSADKTLFLFPGRDDSFFGNSPLQFDSDGYTYFTLSLSGAYSNWFGLPYGSGCLAYQSEDSDWNPIGFVTNLVRAGQDSTFLAPQNGITYALTTGNIYLGTAQPKFVTMKYCFYRPRFDWLPGSMYFSPTNDSPLLMAHSNTLFGSVLYATNDVPYLIVPTGTWTQLAGYAKLAVTNGAPGVFGYLGQYFKPHIKWTKMVTSRPTPQG